MSDAAGVLRPVRKTLRPSELVASSDLVADRLTHFGALRRVPAHGHVQHMTPMLRFHVHVPPEDHGELQRVAHELGVSAAEVVRQGVQTRRTI